MSQLLEAAMMLCFGLSWPLSLLKNIRARSTKTMSLGFILLITAGYIAGITAKLISGSITYVLAVYLFNLVVVAANLVVYFRNLRCDRRSAASNESRVAADAALTETAAAVSAENEQEKLYRELNTMAAHGGIVFFGSDSFTRLPLAELAQSFGLEEHLYNRSVGSATIDEAARMLHSCVLDLHPSKVFVNLGDPDSRSAQLDVDEFIAKYEWLLYTIRANCQSDIYVVSLLSDTAAAREINKRLRTLAAEHGSGFIDISSALNAADPELHAFHLMLYYIRSHPLDFAGAMNIVTA